MKTLLLAVLLSLLAGCGHTTLKVSNRFSADEEKTIQAAADAWCTVNDAACINLIFGAGADADVLWFAGGPRTRPETGNFVCGFEEREIFDHKVTLLPGCTALPFKTEIMHEFGHVLGLDHVGAYAVMEASPEGVTELQKIDIEQFCAVSGACGGAR